MAIINGHFDLAMMLLERGANPNAAAFNGVAPLFAVLNIQWAPKSLYPSPKAYQQQKTTYLELMQALLDEGRRSERARRPQGLVPGLQLRLRRLRRSRRDAVLPRRLRERRRGDEAAGRRTAPTRTSRPCKPAGRPFTGEGIRQIQDTSGVPPVPYGGPGVLPLHAATGVGYGEGFAANSHRYAPTGFLPAIKYLVEETGRRRQRRRSRRQHARCTCARRAATTTCIKFLVSKGADVTRVNREGNTTVDMANGPVQRTQPYPETIKLLEGLGAKNNHRCITC